MRRESEGLLTLVCITCGKEKNYAQAPPESIVCDTCGGTVFTNSLTPTRADQATVSQLEETARHIALDESSSEISPDELRDLNNP
ncbi:MAG: hypothetical protein ABR543_01860 [Gemmatimonadaceae bacterium]